jgi:hypothetical protein
MGFAHITRREFAKYLALLGGAALAGGVAGCGQVLARIHKGRLPDDKYLLLLFRTTSHERHKYHVNDGTVPMIHFDGFADFSIGEQGVKIKTGYMSQKKIDKLRGIEDVKIIVCQELTYNGNFSGYRQVIYFSKEFPSTLEIATGFPVERFSKIPDLEIPANYGSDRLAVRRIAPDGTVDISLNELKISLRPKATHNLESRSYYLEFDPKQVRKAGSDSLWHAEYMRISSASFEINTEIQNLGLFEKEKAEWFE